MGDKDKDVEEDDMYVNGSQHEEEGEDTSAIASIHDDEGIVPEN